MRGIVYLDFRSLCLIIAMRRSGRVLGRHLVPCSLRFPLTEPHRRHTARGPGLGPALGLLQPQISAHYASQLPCGAWAAARAGAWSHTAVDLSSLSLIGAMRPGGTRAEGGGEGSQVGKGGEV